jgi:hypothetical protein
MFILNVHGVSVVFETSIQLRGTAHILPEERAKATFDVELLTNYLDGGKKNTLRRRNFIVGSLEGPYKDGFMEKVFSYISVYKASYLLYHKFPTFTP